VNQLSRLLGQIQRDAAALPTGELKAQLQVHVELLSEYADSVLNMTPDAESNEEMISATDHLFLSALFTALYVRELTTRPVERHFARVRLSFN
jgi:hypothetical protein